MLFHTFLPNLYQSTPSRSLRVLAGDDCSGCNDIDFNNNTALPEDQDVIDFFTVLAGGDC